MPSAAEVLSDPKFQALPLGEQLKVMQKVDPNFAALPAKDQGTVIATSRQKSLGTDRIGQKPKDEGFFPTLKKDVKEIPGMIGNAISHPGDTAEALGGAQHEQFQKGREDFSKPGIGNKISGVGHTMAGALPLVGPMAAQAGEELGGGQPGQGAAHALEALGPSALHEIPIGDAVKAIGKRVSQGYHSLDDVERMHVDRINEWQPNKPNPRLVTTKYPGPSTKYGDNSRTVPSPRAKASLPEPKTAKPTSTTKAAPDPKSPVDAPKRPTPGNPPAETSEAAEAIQAKALGKLLRGSKIRPDDAIKINEKEWPILAKQANVNPPSPKVVRMALEENRKLWAASQNDLQARRAAHFAKQGKTE